MAGMTDVIQACWDLSAKNLGSDILTRLAIGRGFVALGFAVFCFGASGLGLWAMLFAENLQCDGLGFRV